MPRNTFFSALLLSLTVGLYAEAPAADWPISINREQKPWTRWWWLGSAVDRQNITQELEKVAAAGFGGVEITPIYGAKGYEARYLPFLSPEYLEMLAHTTAEAKRLGLGVDMATGTGWPFGGAHVNRNDAELRASVKDGELATTRTKFRVKRAAPGAEGWVLNPFSPEAMTRYLAPFSRAMSQLPAGAIRSQFHDSFEYTANWSEEVFPRFAEMHGYRLEDHVAELGGSGDPDRVARIKYDYRATLADLHLSYMQTWVAWAHTRGQLARNQAHGAPANLIDLYAQSDIPETEVFGASPFPIPGYRFDKVELSKNDPQPLVNRLASSAAHVAGKQLTSSETFTWLREHFHESPSVMKPELDQLFLTGVNHVFYHGLAYSPADAPWPGWLFYASTQANPRNPLWSDFAALNEYIARAQSLLQEGEPFNDFLLYFPIHEVFSRAEGWNRNLTVHQKDWLTEAPVGGVAQQLLDRGFSFDFVSDAMLLQTHWSEGKLKTPGARYTGIIVPDTTLMPAATLAKLADLAQQGATVIFLKNLPRDVPGFGRLEIRRADFRRAVQALGHEAGQVPYTRKTGRGKVVVGAGLDELSELTGTKPEEAPSKGLQVLRRRSGNTTTYFVANLGARGYDDWLEIREKAVAVLLLDPLTGSRGAAAFKKGEEGTAVYLQLAPGETIFIQTTATKTVGREEKTPWTYFRPRSQGAALDATWNVSFIEGGPELPPPFTTRPLTSWTEQGGKAEAFAGTASYTTTFTIPEGTSADEWLLDLGTVRETARVFVNDVEVGRVWSLPFQIRVGSQLKPGVNRLRIDVTNLPANRIRQMDADKQPWKNFHEINFVNIHYRPLDASTWPLAPSGLLGPVRLIPLEKISP